VAQRRYTWRLAAWAAAGVFVGVMSVVLVLNVVARTGRGHAWVLDQTVAALGRDINGTLEIERAAGNLFEGAWLYGIALRDTAGEPFVLADSAWLDYSVRTLLSPNVVINDLVLYQPQVFARLMPGDTVWNYESLFADTTPPAPDRVERATFLTAVRVVNGTIQVEQPWEPAPGLSPARREQALREALAEDSPILVRDVAGGHLWTWNFTGVQAGLSDIRFAPGTEAGSRIHVDSLRASAQVFRDPAEVMQMRGALALLPGRIELEFPVARLPDSDLGIRGVVRYEEDVEGPIYDLLFLGREVAFADLRWLYPRFPEEATGTLSLRLETRPEGTLFLVRDARVRAPGTRLEGSFGMVVGDTVRFTEVDLAADPLDVQVVEDMLPEGLPVRGLRLGGAEIRGES
jgi:hypothetical protein